MTLDGFYGVGVVVVWVVYALCVDFGPVFFLKLSQFYSFS